MAIQFFRITLNVKDVTTGIVLSREWIGKSNCPFRAERKAVAAVKDNIFKSLCRNIGESYDLTAKQLKDMIEDRVLNIPIDLYEVNVAKTELIFSYEISL